MASVVVELVSSEPTRVTRTTYSVLAFDDEGRLDSNRFGKQQFALVESVVAPGLASSRDHSNLAVVEATARFIAQGGQWTPSPALARAIDEAALEQRRCGRV